MEMTCVYSRGAIEAMPPQEVPHVVISITTTADDRARIPANDAQRAVLRMVFKDVDEGVEGAFGEAEAKAIWAFVSEHKDHVKRIVVHCDAGRSRSPAVAAAIDRVLLGSDDNYFRRYTPNMRVYRTLLNVWYEGETTSTEVSPSSVDPR